MKISARKRGKCPYLPVCLACSSGGWWCIIQEILFHLEFSHTIQAINTAFIFFIKDKFETQRPATLQEKPFWLNIKYKNQFLDALSDTSLHTCLRSWRRAVVWALHTYKQTVQSMLYSATNSTFWRNWTKKGPLTYPILHFQ